MLNKVNKLLIGKDIARTSGVTTATTFHGLIVSTVLADGEVVVLDKNKLPLTAGSTYADSDVIFICQGTSVTYTYTNPAGSVITCRKIVISDAIDGAKVRKYSASPYVAKSEQTIVFTPTATITAGAEYVLRVIYKDMPEHPGQFTQTYRVIANATATVAALITQLVAKVNAHTGRRVQATDGTTTLTLTGLEIPTCCTSLSDIDDFSMVEFSAVLNKVNSTTGAWETVTCSSVTTTAAQYGSGNWEQIRDLERDLLGNRGVLDKIHFPYSLAGPVKDTVLDGYYDLIHIEHDVEYLSPDNQYRKSAPKQTDIALATASTGTNAQNQAANIVNILNTWMASTPGSFAAISI